MHGFTVKVTQNTIEVKPQLPPEYKLRLEKILYNARANEFLSPIVFDSMDMLAEMRINEWIHEKELAIIEGKFIKTEPLKNCEIKLSLDTEEE